MFCQSCGQPTPDTARFCVSCGAYLPPASPPGPAGVSPEPPPRVVFPPPQTPVVHPAAYAGFGVRLLAYFIDGVLLSVASFVLLMPILVIIGVAAEEAGTTDDEAIGALVILSWSVINFFLTWMYEAGFLSSRRQATPGKMALSLTVTDTSGARISFARGTGRYFAKILSGFLMGVGFLVQLFTDKRQAMHDLMADTLVVRK